MADIRQTIAAAFARRFTTFLAQAETLSAELSEQEFWNRPYPYGNSVGHLLLHITGNLNYFIGTQVAGTGYVRNRDLEFTDTSRRPKAEVLAALADAVQMVQRTIEAQSVDDWSAPYAAVGCDDTTRLSVLLRCTHHFHHHLGQILYLAREHARLRGAA